MGVIVALRCLVLLNLLASAGGMIDGTVCHTEEIRTFADNSWLMSAGWRVLAMQTGFAMLEAGSVRSKQLLAVFNEYDINGDGSISAEELYVVLRELLVDVDMDFVIDLLIHFGPWKSKNGSQHGMKNL